MTLIRRPYKWLLIATGGANMVGGVLGIVAYPQVSRWLECPKLFILLLAGFAIFSGALVVWAAGDLASRQFVIVADGALRIAAGIAFFVTLGMQTSAVIGLGDAVVGVLYLAGLRKASSGPGSVMSGVQKASKPGQASSRGP